MKLRISILFSLILASANYGFAEEIYLKNGDRISGDIINETDTTLMIKTQAMGEIIVEKKFVKPKEEPLAVKERTDIQWSRKASIGYSQTGGNTEDSQGSAEVSINRKSGHDEYSGRMKVFISTSNNQMDAKKFNGMGRYAYSFGDHLKWYHFFKIEADQDQFANIDYRMIPSTGVGYWFSDEDEWKLMVEAALGFEHTNYRDNTDSENAAVLIPRVFLETTLIESLKLAEDIILYPLLSEGGEYRLHSETMLINPINDQLSWKVSLIDDFNSSPSGNTKKNDFRLM